MERVIGSEEAMKALGAELVASWSAGDVVLLFGDLGAGKTTLVRGMMAGLGWTEAVRSPTFTLLQTYPTEPPVVHADLYRVKSYEGIGLEEYLDDHLVLIEWPDRAEGLVEFDECWQVWIEFLENGRRVRVLAPGEEG